MRLLGRGMRASNNQRSGGGSFVREQALWCTKAVTDHRPGDSGATTIIDSIACAPLHLRDQPRPNDRQSTRAGCDVSVGYERHKRRECHRRPSRSHRDQSWRARADNQPVLQHDQLGRRNVIHFFHIRRRRTDTELQLRNQPYGAATDLFQLFQRSTGPVEHSHHQRDHRGAYRH